MRCEDFLQSYSEFLDGQLEPSLNARFERHVAACSGCCRYHRVMTGGLSLCRDLPEVHSSPDFKPRLQHRLYHIDDGARLENRHLGSAALVAIASVGFLALAWLPFATRMSVEVELPAVAVDAPMQTGPADQPPALFRSGPFVTPTPHDAGLELLLERSEDFFNPSYFDEAASDAARLEAATDAPR